MLTTGQPGYNTIVGLHSIECVISVLCYIEFTKSRHIAKLSHDEGMTYTT